MVERTRMVMLRTAGLNLLTAGAALAGLNCGGGDVTTPTSGSLEIITVTSGSLPDADGYALTIDAGAETTIGPNASLQRDDLDPGPHAIRLSGMATNCTLAGEDPRTVTVAAGDTALVEFSITCTATSGSLEITTTTTGTSPDPDGYTVALDGGTPQAIGTSDSHKFEGVSVGAHQVALAGLSSNCSAAGDNPRTVNATAAASTTVAFTITCTWTGAAHWSDMGLGEAFYWSSIWGTSPTDLFVTGHRGSVAVIWHYDGHSWSEKYRTNSGGLGAIWGSSPTDVFVLGGSQSTDRFSNRAGLLHYDGAQWTDIGPVFDGSDGPPRLEALWGTSPHDLFVGGTVPFILDEGLIAHYDGTGWSRMPVFPMSVYGRVSDFSGTAPTDVYAIGSRSPYDAGGSPDDFTTYVVTHYDGSGWKESFTTRNGLYGVWANSGNDVFAVGQLGVINHYDGRAWSAMVSPTQQDLYDVWGSSDSDVYAVGSKSLLHYDGSRWSEVLAQPGEHVWGLSRNDVYLLGPNTLLHGTP